VVGNSVNAQDVATTTVMSKTIFGIVLSANMNLERQTANNNYVLA
jgi:hypothetical protein